VITKGIQRLLDELEADTSAKWELVEGGEIRAGYGEGPQFWCCPLSWLVKQPADDFAHGDAIWRLKLSVSDVDRIVWAADNCTRDRQLRDALLRACRLSEAS
jgi:hypothetical protein